MKVEFEIPDRIVNVARRAVPSTAGGIALGAATYARIGGIGLAAMGGAVGVTLAPMLIIGGTIGAGAYGLYAWGKANAPPATNEE